MGKNVGVLQKSVLRPLFFCKSKWVFQLKMSFNPDPSQASPRGAIFTHSNLYFNNCIVQLTASQKHLGLT